MLDRRGQYSDYGRGGYGNPWDQGYGREDEMAKAYREVGIANAVVGLVGVLVQASENSRYCEPQGQWTRERVLISPARYETYQVWIPPAYDSRTGAKIGGGFYETRTQVIPEVYEEREVRVVSPGLR